MKKTVRYTWLYACVNPAMVWVYGNLFRSKKTCQKELFQSATKRKLYKITIEEIK